MWARVIEMLVAGWLALSPFVFAHESEATFLWANDLVCAGAVLGSSLLSFRRAWGRLHLANAPVGCWLLGCLFTTASADRLAAHQNYGVTGFVLLMLTVVPSRSSAPPVSWSRFYEEQESSGAPGTQATRRMSE